MTADKLLRSVPPVAWIAAAAALALYLLGRRALDKIGGGGASAAGIGETIGRGAAELVGGTISGAASGVGSMIGSIIKAPSQLVDSTVQSATDGYGLSLGSWLYDLTHDEYDPNARPPGQAGADEQSWWENIKERIT